MVVLGTLFASENADALHRALQCVLLHIRVILAPYQHVELLICLRETQLVEYLLSLISSLAPSKKLRKCAGIFKSYGKSPSKTINLPFNRAENFLFQVCLKAEQFPLMDSVEQSITSILVWSRKTPESSRVASFDL
jgi:hypothetical protein